VGAAIALVVLSAVSQAVAAPDDGDGKPDRQKVTCCHPGKHGTLEGGPLLLPAPEPAPIGFGGFPSTTIESNGDPANRVDIVFVGDGYQASQLGTYASLIAQRWATIRTREPYSSYLPYFNAHRVDVTSVDAGVDGDPTQGILRNTALDMAFWCGGIERLLCVNTSKAIAAAASAPDWDQILAVANATKYGGAGYPTVDVCTFSGSNGSSLEVALHELGHALGDLADEYDYGGAQTYSGPEPGEVNLSTQTSAQMAASQTKWSAWLGVSLPGVGAHGTYEGGGYSVFGIYRPTFNSLMRELNQPFNGPGLEQMIVKIHQQTTMLDAVSHPVGSTVEAGAVVSVTPLQPATHALALQWFLDGAPIAGATGPAIDTALLGAPATGAMLELVVVDPTTKVRSESLRATWLTETYRWTVLGPPCLGDIFPSGQVDAADIASLLGRWGLTGADAGAADLDGNGVVDAADLTLLLGNWGPC
jgi:hypothetical protein